MLITNHIILLICRAARHGGRAYLGALQAQAAPSQVGHAGETGKDAVGGSRSHQAAGIGIQADAVDPYWPELYRMKGGRQNLPGYF